MTFLLDNKTFANTFTNVANFADCVQLSYQMCECTKVCPRAKGCPLTNDLESQNWLDYIFSMDRKEHVEDSMTKSRANERFCTVIEAHRKLKK